MLRTVTFFVFALAMLSCASKTEQGDDDRHGSHHQGVWKEMDEFHLVMAETFHPYKDSADLEPAKTRSGELLAAADKWADAPLPEKVDRQEVREQLKQLKAEVATLNSHVRSADDNLIAEQLTRVHDTFHAIQEAWYAH